MNNLAKTFLIAFIMILGAVFSSASIVDQTFNLYVTKTDSVNVAVIASQPDGKFLVKNLALSSLVFRVGKQSDDD